MAASVPFETLGFSFVGDRAATALQVDVVDELSGLPILDADVQMSGIDQRWVRVRKEGYGELIIGQVPPGRLTVYVKPTGVLGNSEVVEGEPSGYLPFRRGDVEAGLVIRALGVSDLVALNVQSLISPLKDSVNILGARQLPSNLAFPSQRVNFLVSINKPTFRMPMSAVRQSRLSVVHASGGLMTLAGLPSDPGAHDYVNLLTPRKVGWSAPFLPNSRSRVSPAMSVELPQTQTLTVAGYPFEGHYYGMNLIDLESNRQSMVATDVKAVPISSDAQTTIQLKTPATAPAGSTLVPIAAAISNGGNRISAAIATLGSSQPVQFLSPPDLAPGPLPASYAVAPADHAYTVLTAHEASQPVGNRSVQVVVFPSSNGAIVPLADLSRGIQAVRWTLSQLEFDSAHRMDQVSAETLPQLLKRFTFSLAEVQ